MAEGSGAELDFPAADIEEVGPEGVSVVGVWGADKGALFGLSGVAEELHACFVGEAVAFAGVALDAGGDDVFPCGLAAAVTGNDMVNVEQGALKFAVAILAGVAIALEDVFAGEFDLFHGEMVEDEEEDDAGHHDAAGDGVDPIVLARGVVVL